MWLSLFFPNLWPLRPVKNSEFKRPTYFKDITDLALFPRIDGWQTVLISFLMLYKLSWRINLEDFSQLVYLSSFSVTHALPISKSSNGHYMDIGTNAFITALRVMTSQFRRVVHNPCYQLTPIFYKISFSVSLLKIYYNSLQVSKLSWLA